MKFLTILVTLYFVCFSLNAKNNIKKETVITYKVQPWETNEAYIDSYTLEWDLVKKEPEKLAPDEVKKCDSLFNISARFSCKQKISKELTKDYIARGTKGYVIKHYYFLKKYSPKKLIEFLSSMDKLRNKTRTVNYPKKRVLGELTYKAINKEICLIESTIGRLKSKSFCHTRRY